MRTRTVISAIIFLSLCAIRLCFPEEASKLRAYIIPAISREADLREDLVALGQAISGEHDYVYVWERLINAQKETQEPDSSQKPTEDLSPLVEADASDSFALSEMIEQNLIGFETLTPIPSEQATTIEKAETPSPTEVAETPSASEAMSQTLAPIAPETAPIESVAPLSVQSAKVEEFLEAQAAFADYAVPANVSYDTPTLPFEFSDPSASSVTSGFGYRDHPIEGVVKFHYGTDIGAYDGDAITAFADGTVISVQELSGYGRTVMLDHGNGFQTLYAHCSQILVEQGSAVKRGDKIALVGHSGDVTGPHLHFELLYNGKYLNPEFYL